MEGTKYDKGKLRMDLWPPEAIEGGAEVLTYGASKYEDRNWESGIKYSRVFAALMRHLWAWWAGRPIDTESGISHLKHALCCIVFLVTYEERRMVEWDDRPKRKESISIITKRITASEIIALQEKANEFRIPSSIFVLKNKGE